MWSFRVDFCGYCKEYKPVRLIQGYSFDVCQDCLSIHRERGKPKEKVLTEKKYSYKNATPISSKIGKRVNQKFKKTLSDEIYDFMSKHPDMSFSSADIEAQVKCGKNVRNILGRMVRGGSIYARTLTVNGIRSHAIYSVSQEIVEAIQPGETAHQLLTDIRECGYIKLQELAKKLHLTDKNVAKIVRNKLGDFINTYEVLGSYYYVSRDIGAMTRFFHANPFAKKVKKRMYYDDLQSRKRERVSTNSGRNSGRQSA